MPSIAQSYEVILDFTNDTHDAATVQLLRDYGCHSNRIVLLNPGESISLVLDAGDSYKYTVKTKSKVVNVTARAWRDVVCGLSQLFPPPANPWPPALLSTRTPVNGITIDRLFRETRFCLFDYNDT
ncbi:hypothetical protein SCHPADRAFT_863418 [Schizopora paradoxa]|uniref:Uncharacterized protein n=1 Tax=Schizopora paradoxa TaxID=27342 RepID=A0A0H2S8L5_9AGAM|nr:hypothetical protein SCHPADRAFT_863418 [Schizopora paradoxa]